MVSLPTPNSFVHVAHVGMNESGTIEASQGIDPAWKAALLGHGPQSIGPRFPRIADSQRIDIAERFRKGVEAINNNTDATTSTPLNRELLPQALRTTRSLTVR